MLDARDSGTADDEVLRDVLSMLDVEESLLDRLADKEFEIERELTARSRGQGALRAPRRGPRRRTSRTPRRL